MSKFLFIFMSKSLILICIALLENVLLDILIFMCIINLKCIYFENIALLVIYFSDCFSSLLLRQHTVVIIEHKNIVLQEILSMKLMWYDTSFNTAKIFLNKQIQLFIATSCKQLHNFLHQLQNHHTTDLVCFKYYNSSIKC